MKLEAVSLDLFTDGVPEDLLFLVSRLENAGHEAFLVGGAVRDLALSRFHGRPVTREFDYDFATNASPETVQALFSRVGGPKRVFTVPTGIKHGTVTVVIERPGGFTHYEVTTYRIDGSYDDGRHPDEVKFSGDLAEDLSRRDFTVNAMAYDIKKKAIYDPFGGLADLSAKLIRTVGNPVERFSEDGLRPIRACRIAAQVGFEVEAATFEAIPQVIETVMRVSMERVRDELVKLMSSEQPSVGLELLRKSGILERFLPELLEGYQIEQNEYHRHDIYYHNLFSCDAGPKNKPLVRLAALFHDIGKARAKQYALQNGNGNVFYNHEVIGERMTAKILKRLKFSNHEVHYITQLVKLHMFYYTEEWTDGAVRRFLRKMEGDAEFMNDLFDLRRADRIGSGAKTGEAEILNTFRRRIAAIIEADNALKVTDLDIDGHVLMERFGLPPSRQIGDILEYLLENVLDHPEWNTRDELLKLSADYLAGKRNHLSETGGES